ncbi:hypothetical protein BBJ28_00023670, partial [Nothophytophthora sp. Chile5]
MPPADGRYRDETRIGGRRSTLLGWMAVLLVVATLAVSCGWYSHRVAGLAVVESETRDIVTHQQQALAEFTGDEDEDKLLPVAEPKEPAEPLSVESELEMDEEQDVVEPEEVPQTPEPTTQTPAPTPKATPTPQPTTKAPTPAPTPAKTPAPTPTPGATQSLESLWAPVTSIAELEQYECMAWRQTADCSPRGASKPKRDASCDRVIQPTDSGFCEYRHRTTGLLRRLAASPCKSRASQMRYSCANATLILRYSLLADVYKPEYPLSFANNQRDFRQQNGLPLVTDGVDASQVVTIGGAALQPPSSFSQGIAYVVYEQLFLSVYAAIRALRSTGCTLPIELWYREEETNTSHPLLQELTSKYGAFLRVIKDPRATKFYTKLYA